MRLLACLALTVGISFGQTASVPASIPQLTFLSSSGTPLAGAFLCSFQAGTSTPLATFINSGGSSTNTNPIVLNSAGQASVWVTPGTLYKFILYVGGNGACPGSGTSTWTQDNVSSAAAYTLPNATASVLGGVICGTGTSCSSGIISVTPYTLPQATSSVLGGVICGSGVACTAGVISNTYFLPNATSTSLGGVSCGLGTICTSGTMTAEPLLFSAQGFSNTLTFTGSSNIQAFNKTFVLAANSINVAGTTLELDLSGTYSVAAASGSANGTIQISTALDNVDVASSGLISLTNSATATSAGLWTMHIPMAVVGTGISAGFFAPGGSFVLALGTPSVVPVTSAGNTFNLTINHTLQVFAFISATNGQTFQITGYNLKLLYPQFSF